MFGSYSQSFFSAAILGAIALPVDRPQWVAEALQGPGFRVEDAGFVTGVADLSRFISNDPTTPETQSWLRSQSACLSKHELAQVNRARRLAIDNVGFLLTQEYASVAGSAINVIRRQIARIWVDECVLQLTYDDQNRVTEALSFDGAHAHRIVSSRAGRGVVGLSSTSLQSLNEYCDPLAVLMTIDEGMWGTEPSPVHDLGAAIRSDSSYLLSHTVDCDGRSCIALMIGLPATIRVYLSIADDFIPVRVETWSLRMIRGNPTCAYPKYVRRVASVCRATSTGQLFPSEVHEAWQNQGPSLEPQIIGYRRTTIDERCDLIQVVNNRPALSLPVGTVVVHEGSGARWVHGSRTSVGEAIVTLCNERRSTYSRCSWSLLDAVVSASVIVMAGFGFTCVLVSSYRRLVSACVTT